MCCWIKCDIWTKPFLRLVHTRVLSSVFFDDWPVCLTKHTYHTYRASLQNIYSDGESSVVADWSFSHTLYIQVFSLVRILWCLTSFAVSLNPLSRWLQFLFTVNFLMLYADWVLINFPHTPYTGRLLPRTNFLVLSRMWVLAARLPAQITSTEP